jgi:hypothetical protein
MLNILAKPVNHPRYSNETDWYVVLLSWLTLKIFIQLLRGFEKVFLQTGELKSTTFTLDNKLLSYWNVEAQKWIVPKGQYTFHVGASSRDIRLQKSFTLE